MNRSALMPIGPEASDNSPHPSSQACAEVGRVAGRVVYAVFGPRGLREVTFDAIEVTDHERVARAPDAIAAAFDRYFSGQPEAFEGVELDLRGTPFQRRVWEELRRIPHGSVASYGEIARRLGVPRGMRAVGAANGENPIAIVVPCHRVVETRGGLGGYSGGLEVKRVLLALEGVRVHEGRVHVGQLGLFAPGASTSST